MTYKIVIPGELPDTNTIITESKRGGRGGKWQPYNEMKQEYTNIVAWIAKSEIKKTIKKNRFRNNLDMP